MTIHSKLCISDHRTHIFYLICLFFFMVLSSLLSGCSGGSSTPATGLSAPVPTLTFDLKQIRFTWPAVAGADHYRILENPDGASGFTVIPSASNITATSHSLVIPVHKTDWVSAQYIVEACDAAATTCVGSNNQTLALIDSIAATGYIKASNTEANDNFGISVTLSGDGNTLAVGAYFEDSAATGVNNTVPGQGDNSALDAGAVYVYTRSDTTWTQQAYVKASNTGAGDSFSLPVLSGDGNTLAVGAMSEDSAATGINNTSPGQVDNSASSAGGVYVFTRSVSTWTQQAYVKASNTDADDSFGIPALSRDGDTLAVSVQFEDSAATGVNNTTPGQGDNAATAAGAVYLY